MLFPFRTKRSDGVSVTPAVHRLLVRANTARDDRRWGEAAQAYREALSRDPGLAHVWVQLGNMLKEAGDLPQAGKAYEQAFRLRSLDPEPMLQLGRLHGRAGDLAAARLCYERAFRVAPGSAAAAAGLRRALFFAPEGAERDRLATLLLGRGLDAAASVRAPRRAGETGRVLHLDIGDLLEFWSDGRLPTGIQRVQTQLLLCALQHPGSRVELCAFFEGCNRFFAVGAGSAAAAAALSLQGSDVEAPEWVAGLNALHAEIALLGPPACRPGDVLVGLGSSWNMPSYFPALSELRAHTGVGYVPLIYDMTPLVTPRFFTREACADFTRWVPQMLAHAQAAVAISEATRRDLLSTAQQHGSRLRPSEVAVVPLNVDTRLASAPPPVEDLRRWSLRDRGFVLFVATVEPRKGHVVALEAWSKLIERHGGGGVPKLVCVGKRGWLTAEVERRLADHPELADAVVFLGGLGDAQLDLLYRSCLFTIYPSFYEGWGLPVTEALCHGKAVITTTSSSLPEAGGDFALYVEPGDAEALALAASRLIHDDALRSGIELRIAREYRATSWEDTALQLQDACLRLTAA